ncbi:MAG: hypothetical protein IJB02_02955 [Oscillospiraceae bacterium]|nr:hypothetical protein [Oscillospiraceae bacterium]
MDKMETQILGLVQSKGKSAEKMTSAFKFIGNGSMEEGIKRFAKFFSDSGYSKGEQAGIMKGVGGTLGTLTLAALIYYLALYIKQQVQKQKELEKEGQGIIAALESVPDDAGEEYLDGQMDNESNSVEDES